MQDRVVVHSLPARKLFVKVSNRFEADIHTNTNTNNLQRELGGNPSIFHGAKAFSKDL
jgi:hypothetical protein